MEDYRFITEIRRQAMAQRIWNYYCDAAKAVGTDPQTNKPKPYSLEFFFTYTALRHQNHLLKYFLGYNFIPPAELQPPSDNEIRQYTSRVKPPNKSQLKAISNALSYPISMIQGPPGTGKTETILNLISVIHGLYPEKTIAVVSTNNEALTTIADKIFEDSGSDPMLANIEQCFAVLGRKSAIKAWKAERFDLGEDVSEIDNSGKIRSTYLRRYPIFTSTIHSMRKIFTQPGGFDNQFDYVIADECSQMSIMLGLVAISCARNIVLIGDDKQLPPIIKDEVKELSEEHDDFLEIYEEAEGRSILSLCAQVVPQAPSVMLTEHYRCHPSIIGFCNKYVYDGKLEVKTNDDGQFRMRAVWYEGDYCEKIMGKSVSEDGESDQTYKMIYNKRQIEIFFREEFPRIRDRIANDNNFSVAVIAPFRVQIELFEERLEKELEEMALDPACTCVIDSDDIPRLTIHKAQGKGYNMVYLLTTEDYYKNESAWCQRKRLINVAVSRAKDEFCVITSSQWLPEQLQQELTGYVIPNSEGAEPNNEGMYIRKLIRYIADNSSKADKNHGFHKSRITSVFDKIPYYRHEYSTGKNTDTDPYAPARCMENALRASLPEQYTIVQELPLKSIDQAATAYSSNPEMMAYLQRARLDFVIMEGNSVRLIIEVDGANHRDRKNDLQKKRDEMKDRWIRNILDSDNIYLRIPTDGDANDENGFPTDNIEYIIERLKNGRSHLTAKLPDDPNAADLSPHATINMLRKQFARKVNIAFDQLTRHMSRGDIDEEEKLAMIRLDYRRAPDVTYTESVRSSFYLCRFANAYAFEYAMMYDIAMRLRLMTDDKELGVLSFGAGSFLDAWSMAYAKARLALEAPESDELKLQYKGIDRTRWNICFVHPTKIGALKASDGDPELSEIKLADQASDDFNEKAVDSLFEGDAAWLYHCDINEFLENDVLTREGKELRSDVLIFPKIINELKEDDLKRLVLNLEKISLRHDKLYLLVSHSSSTVRESVKRLHEIVSALNSKNEYEVCCDIEEMLGSEEYEKFSAAWLGGDAKLIPSPRGDVPAPFMGYRFENASAQPIAELNSDFNHTAPRAFLWDMQEKYGIIANQMVNATTIVFDVVRLKRRKKDR